MRIGETYMIGRQKEPGAICKRLLLVISTAISLCTRFLGGWWILTWWACDLSSCLDQNQWSSPANSALTLALTSTQHCAPPRSSCGSTLFSKHLCGPLAPLPPPAPGQVLNNLCVPFKILSGVLPRNSRSEGSGSITCDLSVLFYFVVAAAGWFSGVDTPEAASSSWRAKLALELSHLSYLPLWDSKQLVSTPAFPASVSFSFPRSTV